uniref:Secreted protein n=1 Tax=Bionectria ochroleuca TaxID=29856 RepID=A0A8H7K838_BIOOC
MVAIHNLGLAAFVWLGLASKGLAMGIDESTDGLYLVERDEPVELEARTRRGRPGDDPRTWGPNAGGHGPRQGGKGTRSIDDFETELFTRTRRGGRPGDDPRTWGPNAGGHGPRQGGRGTRSIDDFETELFTRTRRGGRPGDDPRTWGPNAGGHAPRQGRRGLETDLFTRTRRGGRPGDDPRTWGPNAGGHGPRHGGKTTRDYDAGLFTRTRKGADLEMTLALGDLTQAAMALDRAAEEHEALTTMRVSFTPAHATIPVTTLLPSVAVANLVPVGTAGLATWRSWRSKKSLGAI